ncbi:MAG TPA: glycoside hydrolase family 31 protein [Candidatus Faeciplasma avium]|uniref:Glycoside hydrolase family 31 protein n=1 Tax=Candidatus Faeciplasma avium TaxID=2840798 RepID=A0A9D1NSD3_9FIRM|nr:glycoside hydrolase family 31 protein [Candidatus Faeciplasma avium]
MGIITIKDEAILFERRDETVLIEPYGDDCIRVRASKNSRLSDERWTLLEPVKAASCEISGDQKRATMKNGMVSVTVSTTNDWGGELVFKREDRVILSTKNYGDYVMRYQHTEGDNYRIRYAFNANPGEHIYGLGQEQEDAFDRKGTTTELQHYNTKSVIPVYYSSLGYGFIWNNPSPGRCETTLNHTMWVADSAYQADYLVFAGRTPRDTMKIYSRLTGFAPMMPSWAAGFWQCKCRYESQDILLNVAREYKKRGIPIDAIVIDFFHWTEQGDLKFDPKYWPDPKAMVEELSQMGIETVVSVWPTISPRSENWRIMNERNMLVRTENGQYPTFDFFGLITYIDPTNPETASFYWDKVRNNYYSYGIKNFWLDEAEPEVHPQQFANLKFYAGNGAQTALLYPYYYNKIFYDGLRSEGETDIISLTRAAYIGSQRVGACVWNGDIMSSFHALKQSITSGLSMAMCGIPWWNSDIGGFLFGDTESESFRELIVRWFQFGLFCPIMRLHGTRLNQSYYVDEAPDVMVKGGGYNEIWHFGEENYRTIEKLINTRIKMRDYTLSLARDAHENGAPMMRPMFFEFPDDPKCYELWDQYMYGPDILFAPIYNEHQTDREVYLPAGEWVSVLDGMIYQGGASISVHAEIDQYIAFVRKGQDVLKVFFDNN